MPYINENDKRVVEDLQGMGVPVFADKPGTLNFLITQLVVRFLEHNGLSYTTINSILGALEGAKLELYRRVAVPYENQKISENGDVYPVELTQGGQK